MKRLLLLAIVPLLLSCGGDDEETPVITNKQAIIGKWVKSQVATSSDYTKFVDVESKDTMIFTQDSYTQIYQRSPQTPTTGSYTVDDVYLVLDGIWTYRVSFDGSSTMLLRQYGYGDDNSLFKYLRLR